MVIGSGRQGDPDRSATLRGVLLIVIAGIVLGVAFNALGLAARPPRGLAWIGRPQALPRVESLQAETPATSRDSGSAAASAAADPPATSRPALVPPANASPEPEPEPSAPAASSAARPAARPVIPAAPGAQARPPAERPPAVTRPEPPVIPDVAGPLQLELPTLKQLYDADAALIVDAREAEEYADGHIPGAVHLSYNDALAEPERVERLDSGGRPYVIYCSGGTCELSSDLAKVLVEAGKRRVLVFEGGLPEWQAAGYPIARGESPGGRP